MRTLSALAAIAVLAVAAPAAAGSPVQLRDQLVDSDGRVTLGDLFEGAGAAAGVVLAAGPAAGGNVVLDAGRVQAIARNHGLDWSNANGFRRLVVKAEDAGAAAQAGPARPAARTVEVLTYARSLAAGEIVQPEDVIWTEVQAHLAPRGAPSDASAVIGQAARRPVRSGAPVAAHDLSAPQVIRRDELVTVAYNVGGVSLSLQGKALQGAAVGEPVSILNPQSKKTIVAVASGPGQAVVGPEAESLKSARFASIR